MTQHYNCHSFGAVELASITCICQLISQVTLFVFSSPFLLYFQLIPLYKYTNVFVVVLCIK